MKPTLHIVRNELIGNDAKLQTPYGKRLLTYADYTASGRTVAFIEKHLIQLQSYYANSHTEDSYTGKAMTTLLHEAMSRMKRIMNASEDYLIPVGTGSTGAIQKFAEILGVYKPPGLSRYIAMEEDQEMPVVFIGPYEHHSNDLIWRESLAEVVTIGLDPDGDLDLEALEQKLSSPEYDGRLKIGSFSAASNVTGLVTPLYQVAQILHDHGAYACFDFAASGPYVEIDMNHGDRSWFDAVYLSPHKFLGGPGACGLLLINRRLYHDELAPTVAGGGTVDYVSPTAYDFTKDVETREMAGTPGILQILKACLAFELKDTIGLDAIMDLEKKYTEKAFNLLSQDSRISILGPQEPERRIGIFSFNIRYQDGYLHHRFVARLLNDLFGIQSRAGCACAGPYGHALLGIDDDISQEYRGFIEEGVTALKPGWVRVNFHYIMTDAQVNFICNAILFIAEFGYLFLQDYTLNMNSGSWDFVGTGTESALPPFGVDWALCHRDDQWPVSHSHPFSELYAAYLDKAHERARFLQGRHVEQFVNLENPRMENRRWFFIKKVAH